MNDRRFGDPNAKKELQFMLIKFLILFILLTVVMPVQAGWTKIDAASKPGEAHFFDPDAIQKQGMLRKVWLLSSYDQLQTGGHRATKILYQLDCTANRARPVTILLYPDKDAVQAVIGALHDENREWFEFPAQSMFHAVAVNSCAD